jgi:hypothetical protein
MTRAIARIVTVLALLVVSATVAYPQTTCTPPAIVTHPTDQTITVGNSATLSATATGTGLAYQWFRYLNGYWLSVSGATSPTVTVSPTTTTAYRVLVTNACGSATSRSATVAVCDTPEITVQPANTTVEVGGRVTLSVTATGSTLAYQWYSGQSGNTTNPLVGATASSLTISAVNSSRSYWVRVSNDCGSENSQTARVTVAGNCVSPGISVEPASTTIQSGQTATLSVSATGSAPAYQWYIGASGNTGSPLSGATASSYTTSPLTSTTDYWVRISNSCGSVQSATATVTVGDGCLAPSIVSAPKSATIAPGATATLNVVASGTGPLLYQWYRGASGNTTAPFAGATSSSFTTPPLTASTSIWVQVSNGCGHADSSTAVVTVNCAVPPAPDAEAPAQVLSGTSYTVSWAPVSAAARYEIEEADNPDFAGAVVSGSSTTTSSSFAHTVSQPTRYYYRVRAFGGCEAGGPYSVAESVAVVLAPSASDLDPNVTAPEGSLEPIMFRYLLMPPAGGKNALDTTFSTTTDKPWMTASPASGSIPPGGTTITVAASPSTLPTGTSTGTLKVTSASGATLANVPISVTIVTPVTTVPKGNPQDDALVVPVVGHAQGGLSSLFLSDVRITNNSNQDAEYLLMYTPSRTSGKDSGKQSRILVRAQETKALNDVVRNWFGFGSMGESALGVLEVRPLASTGSSTVASSRTYNMTPDGTFGQFIPAIPYADFVGKQTKISLQQIAQSAAYRTNFGIVEGSGQPATAAVRVYNAFGQKRAETTMSLLPFEHQQWNRLLETLKVTDLADGRIEVEVTSSTGRVTAYASVVDNATNDPLLVFPVVASDVRSRKYVVPGVADLNTGSASWRTDLRIFNAGPASVSAVITFHESRHADGTLPAPLSRPATLQPGDVTPYDNVLQSLFGVRDVGGLIHITTPSDSSLVVTGRTYDRRPVGTYGQFVPAVTTAESVGIGDRTLEILQVEESSRYRTNLGIAETSGNPVVVEIHAFVPDSTVVIRKEVSLAANEFTQITRVLQQMQIPVAYNARLTVRVIGGTGRVTAYASVVDNKTQDPTYVPAQ